MPSAAFWAKITVPMISDSERMPERHWPYSTVSGTMAQKHTTLALAPIAIKARIAIRTT
ncbi:hypothetical protein D3C84_1240460 [compost metagenome]